MEFWRILFYGIRFDISAILILGSPFIIMNIIPLKIRYNKIYQSFGNFFLYFFCSIGLAVNFIDIIYFRFILKRTTGDIFNFLANEESEILNLIPKFFIDFWYIFVLWLIFVFLLIKTSNIFKVKSNSNNSKNLKYYLTNIIIFLILAFFTVVGIRGGFQLKPISPITAVQYTSIKNTPLILNSAFSIIKTIDKKGVKEEHYFENGEKLNSIYSPIHHANKIKEDSIKLNVIIIIMESFSTEHIGALNREIENGEYLGYTPFLDSLISESLVYKGFADGKRSIEGVPAIVAGLPTLMNLDYLSSIYSGNKINSLASLLKAKGYSTSFYHGGNNGTMSFDVFAEIAGYENYFGRNEYNNDDDFDGKWGIFDEEYFQYFANELNKNKQPFFSTIFSLSSHHPYTIPEKHKGKFRKGNLEIHESIMYADYSLQKFFKTASEMPWFDNTLFVITADHTSEHYFDVYQTSIGNYKIPIIFYQNNSKLKGIRNEVAQQTDIMPTVLNYINFDEDYVAFGENVLDTNINNFAINYLNGTYQIIRGNYVLYFDGKKSISLFNYKSDKLLKNNLLNEKSKIVNEIEILAKAIIQQYNYRLINNKLIVTKE
jgi:phosphoglycerol transferase MdoB-like AlkP superfamily enzyme